MKIYYDSLINCSCNYANGETYTSSKTIKIIADDGFEFVEQNYNWTTYDDNYNPVVIKFSYSPLELTNTNSSRDFNDLSEMHIPKIEAFEKTIEKAGSFLNVYSVDNEILKQLSSTIFSDSGVDLGQYIINLFVLPIKLDDELKNVSSDIMLGTVNTNIETIILSDYIYELDLGNITVDEKYQNVYDYINTTFILYVPWFDKIYLNSEYVVGCTLTLKLIIDLYSGVGTLQVSSSFSDSIIFNRNNIISYNIPFMQKSSNAVIGKLSNFNINNINQAYVEVIRNKPYTNTNNINDVIEYGRIGDFDGYIRCDNINLVTGSTNSEKEEILELLKAGVII